MKGGIMNSYEICAFSLSAKEKEECRKKQIPNFYWYYLQIQEKNLGIKDLKKLILDRIVVFPFLEKKKINLAGDISKQIREFVLKYQADENLKIAELEEKFDCKIFSLIKKVFRRREIVEKSRRKKKKERELKWKKTREIISKTDSEILPSAPVVSAVPKSMVRPLLEKTCAKKEIVKIIKGSKEKKIEKVIRGREISKKSRDQKQGLKKICQITSNDGEILRPTLSGLKGPKDWDCLYFLECRAFAKKNGMCLDCSFCDKRYYI